MEDGKWCPLRAGRNGPLTSHLMFADDLLLFGQATTQQMDCVNSVLDRFCESSGQLVSREKTSIYFSKNVSSQTRRSLAQQSWFKEVQSLGKYLGVPLTGKAPTRSDFHHLVEKVNNKLASWKAK